VLQAKLELKLSVRGWRYWRIRSRFVCL